MSLVHAGKHKKPIPLRCLDTGTTMGILEVVSMNAYPQARIAYKADGRRVEYRGFNKNATTETQTASWMVIKYQYNAANRFIRSKTLEEIAWDAITAASWGF